MDKTSELADIQPQHDAVRLSEPASVFAAIQRQLDAVRLPEPASMFAEMQRHLSAAARLPEPASVFAAIQRQLDAVRLPEPASMFAEMQRHLSAAARLPEPASVFAAIQRQLDAVRLPEPASMFAEMQRHLSAAARLPDGASVWATIVRFDAKELQPILESDAAPLDDADADELGTVLKEMGFESLSLNEKLRKLYEIATSTHADVAALRTDVTALQGRTFSQKLKKLAGAMAIALVGCFITAAWDYYLKEYVLAVFEKLTPKQQKKEIKKALIREEPAVALRDLRIVRRETDARAHYKSKSELLAILPCGKIMKILKKRKKWALVEFESDTEIMQAWVRHKYIERIAARH